MTDLKTQHILTLSHLFSKGGKHNFITITTASLGKNIGKSQQAASLHLKELENGGFIERVMTGRHVSVKITQKGYSELVKLHSILGSTLVSSPSQLELNGSIISGLGEGAYYMALNGYTKQFKVKIGYIPFPGTLNIKLNQLQATQIIQQLDDLDGVTIEPFSDGKRTYGWVKCFHATLNESIKCELIRLERTHHDSSVIELISKNNLRKTARLQTGSKVTVRIDT